MIQDYFNNSKLTDVLGGSLKLDFIPGLTTNGTTASLGSLVASAVNIIYIVLVVVVIYRIIRSAIKRIQSEGDAKGVESATKSLRNIIWALVSMFVIYIVMSFVWIFFTGSSLLDAPNAFRMCGNTSLFDYSKAHPDDTFFQCVDGQFK